VAYWFLGRGSPWSEEDEEFWAGVAAAGYLGSFVASLLRGRTVGRAAIFALLVPVALLGTFFALVGLWILVQLPAE
jgi:choline-glycine betaine transporter